MDEEQAQPDRIVVAIDGSSASRTAVRWASEEARMRRITLIITHVESVDELESDHRPPAFAGGALLEQSAVTASHHEPGVPVATMLLRGSVLDELVKLSWLSVMLVLGVDLERSRATHGALGPIEDRVVAHAACPVVVVNSAFRNVRLSPPHVVVGWTANETGHRALAAAAAEAAVRDATLTIVSVEAPLSDPEPATERRRGLGRALLKAKSSVRERHPTVPVDLVQSSGGVAESLIRHSLNADLLVVGCHHTSDRWSLRTGPVAQAVMRQAGCPVMLVGRLTAEPWAAAESLSSRRIVTEPTH